MPRLLLFFTVHVTTTASNGHTAATPPCRCRFAAFRYAMMPLPISSSISTLPRCLPCHLPLTMPPDAEAPPFHCRRLRCRHYFAMLPPRFIADTPPPDAASCCLRRHSSPFSAAARLLPLLIEILFHCLFYTSLMFSLICRFLRHADIFDARDVSILSLDASPPVDIDASFSLYAMHISPAVFATLSLFSRHIDARYVSCRFFAMLMLFSLIEAAVISFRRYGCWHAAISGCLSHAATHTLRFSLIYASMLRRFRYFRLRMLALYTHACRRFADATPAPYPPLRRHDDSH